MWKIFGTTPKECNNLIDGKNRDQILTIDYYKNNFNFDILGLLKYPEKCATSLRNVFATLLEVLQWRQSDKRNVNGIVQGLPRWHSLSFACLQLNRTPSPSNSRLLTLAFVQVNVDSWSFSDSRKCEQINCHLPDPNQPHDRPYNTTLLHLVLCCRIFAQ